MSDQVPELVFDDELAVPVFPRPVVKYAVLVPVHENFPAFIRPEWDTDGTCPQVFLGSYYLILRPDGQGRYGSAKIQWENMHTPLPIEAMVAGVPAIAFVKTTVPMGYRVRHRCAVVTLELSPDGTLRENRPTIEPGTLVLRQPGGEVQHVRRADEASAYFTDHAEVERLGLLAMSQAQFADWAVAQAMATLRTAVRV